jgi:hypothetical protein
MGKNELVTQNHTVWRKNNSKEMKRQGGIGKFFSATHCLVSICFFTSWHHICVKKDLFPVVESGYDTGKDFEENNPVFKGLPRWCIFLTS